jgi:hypothetical protein
MNLEELVTALTTLFGDQVQTLAPGSFQIETPDFRLLVLLSENQLWLRVLLPIAPAQDAEPYFEQLLEANFDTTQETRYALHQGVVWLVFQRALTGLGIEELQSVIQQMIALQKQGFAEQFHVVVERRIRQIIQAAKQQGQSMETTMKTLDRFYREGLMGELDMDEQSREATMAAWEQQLKRLWDEVEA